MAEAAARLRDYIEAVAQGDRPALERIYEVTGPKLYGVVLRILRKPALAEQALVEAYLRIWQDAANYAPYGLDPISWFVMHARRAAFDLARKRAELGHDEMAEILEPGEAEEPEAGRVVSDELKHLLGCMAALSPDPRLMTLLAYYDGWSHAELAIEFDAPPGTIRTWLLRGLEQIRECAGS